MSNRILVVDDEPDITALVAYHLARGGYRVSTAGTGQEALKAAREERPDVVVLDLMLPGVSGYEVLRELRRHPDTADVGVILLTARREEADRIKGLSLGTGQEALKAAREERPDVVVLDLMLPGVSGYEVLRELRRHPDTADVGVIL